MLQIESEKRRRQKEKENDPAFIKQMKDKESCKNIFWNYCVYMDPEFFDSERKPHLEIIAEALQRVEEKQIMKLIISLPPRAGKSYIISMWCTWMLGKHSEGSIMRNCYGQELANKFSYDIRAIIQLPKYLEIFPHIKLRRDKANVIDWALQTSKQSAYFCSGVGGAITGKGCNLVAILDDPIKNIEDALSETILDKTWQWYTSTHKSRIEKNCPEIIIATRWSRNDPTGKVIESQPGQWLEIKVPALDDKGESFCDDIKSTKEYLELKEITDSFIWEAEYMQKPIEAKGLLFPIEELNRFSLNELHDCDAVVGYVDVADEGTDFLSAPIGKLKGQYVYITDVVFTQEPIEITEASVAQQIIDNQPNKVTVESNNGGKSFAKNIKELIKDKCRTLVNWKANTTNKETRILMKSGQVKKYFYFRNDYKPGSDYDKFMRNLTSYVKLGKNAHDDAPDSVTGLSEVLFVNKVSILK